MRWIGVNGTSVSDAGLAAISDLPNLKSLDLEKTLVTDEGLRHLEKMPSLAVVNLAGSNVTSEGVWRLRLARPDCQINWDD
jgi:hypothetical protein